MCDVVRGAWCVSWQDYGLMVGMAREKKYKYITPLGRGFSNEAGRMNHLKHGVP